MKCIMYNSYFKIFVNSSRLLEKCPKIENYRCCHCLQKGNKENLRFRFRWKRTSYEPSHNKAFTSMTPIDASNVFLKKLSVPVYDRYNSRRWLKSPPKDGEDAQSMSQLFTPLQYQSFETEEHLGEDIVGPIMKEETLAIINRFYTDREVKELARDQGLDQYLYQQTIISFRKYCVDSNSLPTDLHIVFNDIMKGGGHIHDLYPYFFKHAKSIFPHLECMEDLYKISDLTHPPNWYPEARAINRKIIVHVGPTNSGKTYHAMEQFLNSESAVYCGPLKMLAHEVYQKSNKRGTACDLVTGEERKYAVTEEFPANHVACTVEMVSTTTAYEVAVIDEIQMIRDQQRGWAWTRALLGIAAKEIHLCGEGSSVEIIKELGMTTGEDVEIRRYKRLTKLTVEDTALCSLSMVQPGDCIVCFSKQHIHKVAQYLETLGQEVAVIYGGLPPGAKLLQAQKFNDPDNPCKVMVATDAIGMGLNLSIRRVVFYSMIKPTLNEKGETEMDTIDISSALQIGGRAGRFGTQYEEGFVTTYKPTDLPTLHRLFGSQPGTIEKCGLHPTADQIELFTFHLPNYTLSNLIDIFVNLCKVDTSLYFMCKLDDFKFLADLIQHIPLSLRPRYVFCCAPISKKASFACAMFLKFARRYSQGEPATLNWVCQQVKWPLTAPKTIHALVHLEEVFDVLDLYLWLSYRFPDMFPDGDMMRGIQQELDKIIQVGVTNITSLLKNASAPMVDKVNGKPLLREDRFESTISGLPNSSSNRLTERILSQGLLSKNMLNKLKQEWQAQEKISNNKNNLSDSSVESSTYKKKNLSAQTKRPRNHNRHIYERSSFMHK